MAAPSSRELVRRIDATEAVVVAQVLPDMVTRGARGLRAPVHGVVLIPTDFERDLLHGRPSPVALYSDASYFLMNSRVSGTVAAAVPTSAPRSRRPAWCAQASIPGSPRPRPIRCR